MDKLPDHMDSSIPPLPLIPVDSDSLTDSYVSVLGGFLHLNNDVEITSPAEHPPSAPNISPKGSGQDQSGRECDA